MDAPEKKRILVVDDDPEITRMLQFILERHGYAVSRAHGTAQGMNLLANETPDLVLLDFMMPHLNGLELCAFIRRDPRTAETPVIIYSADCNPENIRAALDAGATRFLPKTLKTDELLKSIAEALQPSDH